jgi:hypothetical protein
VALRDVQIDIFNFQSLVTCSGGYDIWFSSTSFKKSNISWPQQPPREKILDINENLDFWWSIPQKKNQYWSFWWEGWSDHQTKEVLLRNRDIEAIKASAQWGWWGQWGCRGFKAWKLNIYEFKVIQGLKFSFILMFWKQFFFVKS